jgi:DNA mismatch repair protein MutL
MPIQVLSPALSAQIAAGEVIERPSSVVKELLENSLDAAAEKISLAVEQGGIDSIIISDDGVGIPKDELPLALKRHATSKISSFEDLTKIMTLGFRGEALASIASVSKLKLASKAKNSPTAWCVETEGLSDEIKIQPTSLPHGTRIEVLDLFSQVPARKKFLRTAQTEFSHVEEIAKRIALSNFSVGFSLTHNQKPIWNLPSANTKKEKENRLAKLLGETFLENSLYLENEGLDLKLSGWITKGSFMRNQPDMIYFYINHRITRDKLIFQAIRKAYQEILPPGKNPGLVLFLTIDPTLVDVNVHPAKNEVRFRDGSLIFDFLVKNIQRAISGINISFPKELKKEIPSFTKPSPQKIKAELKGYQQLLSPLRKEEPSFAETILQFEAAQRKSEKIVEPLTVVKTVAIESQPEPLGYALAQLAGTYILAENKNGLILVDIHAAHERITLEKLKNQYAENNIISQNLLVPISIKLTYTETNWLENNFTIFEKLGFEFSRTGRESIALRQVPMILKDADLSQLIRDTVSDLINQEMSSQNEEYLQKVLATIACHNSVRSNQKLSLLEMNDLLKTMTATEKGGICAHGRPTWIELSLQELEKMFKRQ